MKSIAGVLFVLSVLLLPGRAFSESYDMDFTFEQSDGKIIVIDGFNKLGKSGISIGEIKNLLKENAHLRKEIETLNGRVKKLEAGPKINSSANDTKNANAELKGELKRLQEKMNRQEEQIRNLERKK